MLFSFVRLDWPLTLPSYFLNEICCLCHLQWYGCVFHTFQLVCLFPTDEFFEFFDYFGHRNVSERHSLYLSINDIFHNLVIFNWSKLNNFNSYVHMLHWVPSCSMPPHECLCSSESRTGVSKLLELELEAALRTAYYECWELSLDSLQEQQVLLTTELSPLSKIFNFNGIQLQSLFPQLFIFFDLLKCLPLNANHLGYVFHYFFLLSGW